MAVHVRGTDGRTRAVAATILTLAIALLHFLAMAAAQVVPDPALAVPHRSSASTAACWPG